MIESFEVGAVFRIVDTASATLKALSEQFKILDGFIVKTQESLTRFSRTQLGGLSTRLTGIGEAADRSALAVSGAFSKIDASADASILAVGRLKAEMASLGAAGRPGVLALPGPGGGGSGGGRPPLGSGRQHITGPHFNSSLPGVAHTHVGFGNSGFATGGIVAAVAGFEAVKYGMELSKIQENLKLNGVSDADISRATNLSYDLGEKFGQPVQSILQTIDEIRNPLGGINPAMDHIKHLGDAMVVLRAQDIKSGKPTADALYSLVKSTEFRNAIHGEDFDKAVDAMVRADVATAGRVGPGEFLKMSKYMRSALPGLSDDFLYRYAPELAQEFGGSSAGTSLAAVYQQVVSGQMRTTGLRLLDSLGEIDRTKVDFDKNGRIVKARPGANTLGDVFKRDPAEYAQKLIEDLNSHGITQEGAQRDYMSMIFGNRNSAQMMMTLGYQRMRLDRGAAGIGSTLPIDKGAQELLAKDPTTNMNAMTSSLTNMLTAGGQLAMPAVTQFFKDATGLFNFIRDPQSSSQFAALTRPLNTANTLGPQPWYADHALARAGYRGNDLASEMGREASRGKALAAAQPPPVVNITNDFKASVSVTLDGNAIAAAVQTRITKDNRVINSAAQSDGADRFKMPEMH